MPPRSNTFRGDGSTNSSMRPVVGSILRLIGVIAMGVAGIAVWMIIGPGRGIGSLRWGLIAGAGLLGLLPPVARMIGRLVRSIERPSARRLQWMTLAIALISTAYLLATAILQDRDLFPKTHDDCSYAIGMQMLAAGRLWMAALPLPDFFDNFYILVRPAYCSIYFPGTALLYVAAIWLHLPWCVLPAMASGAAAALLYRIGTELIDGAAGLLAAVLLVCLSWFRVYSILVTGHVPMLLFGLLMIWCWLRYRRNGGLAWAAALGAAAGWAAIIRPADAVIYALPIALAFALHVWRNKPRYWPLALMLVVATAAPFLALQAVFDYGVTGHVAQTPYGYYLRHDQPGSEYGFHHEQTLPEPESALPQKHDWENFWVKPKLPLHTPGNMASLWLHTWLALWVDVVFPCRLMLVLAGIGLVGLFRKEVWVAGAVLPLFFLIYTFNPFFLEHYAIAIAPVAIVAMLMGGRQVAMAFPRWAGQIAAAFVLLVMTAAITNFWEVNRWIAPPAMAVSDETFASRYLRVVNLDLPQLVRPPAVVLFVYHHGELPEGTAEFFQEPVFNFDAANIDDCPIIRAHDLGPVRDREIFTYYAKRQPERVFWRFDRTGGADFLRELGSARDLAK